MTDNHIETALRAAMERRAAKVPSLPDDFAQQVMNKMNARKENANQHRVSTPLHYGRGWGWVCIAAAIILAFLLWPESHEAPIKQSEQQPVIAEMTPPESVPMEKVEAETPVLQTQTVPKQKSDAVVSKPQRIASKPRTPAPDALQSIISTDDPQLVAAVEPAIREQIRTVHIAPGQVMYVLEVSNQPPSVEMPSVSELRARGVRLTADVQQHLQQASIQF
ncbi:MAG: hypothetical protein K6G70_01660 [Bacteroidaceae bacterium]|nr:hypothetical protein [Bacteroidaceae bacterium]